MQANDNHFFSGDMPGGFDVPPKARLIVCVSTWLVQGPSVPVEAAVAADNAN